MVEQSPRVLKENKIVVRLEKNVYLDLKVHGHSSSQLRACFTKDLKMPTAPIPGLILKCGDSEDEIDTVTYNSLFNQYEVTIGVYVTTEEILKEEISVSLENH